MLGQYKFEIRYTLGKDNTRIDALLRRSDYIENKEPVSYSILKQNKDGTLSANVIEFNYMLQILNDKEEAYPIVKGKYQVPQKQETEYIRRHYDDALHRHPGIAKTLEILQRQFTFPKIKDKVKKYILQYTHC